MEIITNIPHLPVCLTQQPSLEAIQIRPFRQFPVSRSVVGTMSLSQVNYVEIHADTWDYGFTLWVDGVQFNPCYPITGIEN